MSPAKQNLRNAARRKIFQPGEMLSGGTTTRVHLLDLSCTGALVYADLPPSPGMIVRLSCPSPLGAARVMWARGKRFGVAFSTPLRLDAIDSLLAQQPSLSGAATLVIR